MSMGDVEELPDIHVLGPRLPNGARDELQPLGREGCFVQHPS